MSTYMNTLYITTQGAYLSREGETILVRIENETKLRIPIHTLSSIVAFGQVMCSPPLLAFCCERGVTVTFLSEYGRFLARVEGPTSGNVMLRREQYRRSDDPKHSAAIAYVIVAAKIANARSVLQRAIRDHSDQPNVAKIQGAVEHLSRVLASMNPRLPLDSIRGMEGDSARVYFEVFDHLIISQKTEFSFQGRSRRPPLDNVNTLLSFLYTLLLSDIRGAVESVGLDPQVGSLHRDRPGRPSLALDLMEEHRAWLADRLALSLINRQQIRGQGFKKGETGGIVMNDDTRKQVLVAWQERKAETITHPFLNEKMTIAMTIQIQARLYSRFLRGDLDGYPPFLWR